MLNQLQHAVDQQINIPVNFEDKLEVIREEQNSPLSSTVENEEQKKENEPKPFVPTVKCVCANTKFDEKDETELDTEKLHHILNEKEMELRKEFQKKLEKETSYLKERFNFVLQNEQARSSLMLREAYRERKEKISVLQTQLECKNLAGLMYVMCAERRKGKLEKLQIIEKYTEYINNLHEVLSEGQSLILHLSRGYKTAARVNYEWQEKMKSIIAEFQNFIYNFAGGSPETNQYFFDLPALLRCEVPIEDDLREDPIEEEESATIEEEIESEETAWYQKLNNDSGSPFVIFGDMETFKPPERRLTLQRVKAAKTAPRKWKEYAFHDTFIKSNCPMADKVKDYYLKRVKMPDNWECLDIEGTPEGMGRHVTTTSVDIRGNMGSILKIMTASGLSQCYGGNRAALLGARDSLEIASTTKLRAIEKCRQSARASASSAKAPDTYTVGSRKTSFFEEARYIFEDNVSRHEKLVDGSSKILKKSEIDVCLSNVSSIPHTDSLEVVPPRNVNKDKISYEKVCPMEKCKRMRVDSFMNNLPPYMNANPFTVYEETFENYQACSPEQLEILKERLNEKKRREKSDERELENPLDEWMPTPIDGIGVQTSIQSISLSQEMPPCNCYDPAPSPTPSSSVGRMFDLANLYSEKLIIDQIKEDCLHDDLIQFNRFKVVGQDSSDNVEKKVPDTGKNFTTRRLNEIKKILKQHPSLCEIFQANTRC